MWLIWCYGAKTGQRAWQNLVWGMFPSMLGALAVVTWHYYDNTPNLAWLGNLQAAMTLLGNITLMMAGYGLYRLRPQNQFNPDSQSGTVAGKPKN